MNVSIRTILEELGYSLSDEKGYWRAKPLYRESGNPTSMRINKETGDFYDFSANIRGDLKSLIKLTLGLQSINDAISWLEKKGGIEYFKTERKPKIEFKKEHSIKVLDRLLPSYGYYLKKGISEETLKLFQGGLATYGKMLNRFVFPIINHNDTSKILGFAGRDVTNSRANKWKLIGQKADWCFPLNLNKDLIEDEIIIVESIGDLLALWECGIKNVWALCGVTLGREIVKQIISNDIKRVIVATNNEPDNQNIGNLAAFSIEKKINKLMGGNTAEVRLPKMKDFGEMLEKDKQLIIDWYGK